MAEVGGEQRQPRSTSRRLTYQSSSVRTAKRVAEVVRAGSVALPASLEADLADQLAGTRVERGRVEPLAGG